MTSTFATWGKARFGLLALAFAGLASWSWRKGADLRVDFGEELYIPWRLSEGAVLYRDVAFTYGPLSKHLDALLFTLTGPSVTSLLSFNLVLLAGFTVLLDRLFAQLTNAFTATCGVLLFLSVFAFGQYVAVGNYNFISPYRHEAVHGSMLAFCALAAFFAHARERRVWTLGLVGLSLGGVLLTKPELFVAASAGVGVGLGLLAVVHGRAAFPFRANAAFAAGLLGPLFVFALYFTARGMSWSDANAGALGAWTPLLSSPGTASGKFFLFSMGLDQPEKRLTELGWSLLGLLGAVGTLGLLDVAIGRLQRRAQFAAGTLVVLALGTLGMSGLIHWDLVPRALPVVSAAVMCGAAVLVWKRRTTPDDALVWLRLAALAGFSLALLPKIFFYTRVKHFGFYLALPASLTLGVMLLHFGPGWLRTRSGAKGQVFLAGALTLLLGFCLSAVRLSTDIYATKTLKVGTPTDWLYGFDPRVIDADRVVADTLQAIEAEVPPQATLVALPEGVMFNYLARRASSIPYTVFTTTELSIFGEPAMLESLEHAPPDFVLWVQRDMSELGVGAFGQDPAFGRAIGDWVRSRYEVLRTFETDPRSRTRYGVQLLKRR